MTKILLGFIFAIVVAACMPTCTAGEKNTRAKATGTSRSYACAYFADKRPIMDGMITGDTFWQGISPSENFMVYTTTKPATKQTWFKLAYNKDGLFLGIHCREPRMDKLKTKGENNGELWDDDSIEIFLFPTGAERYLQFIVNAAGARYNGTGYDKQPLGKWNARVHRGKNYFEMEIEIPFASLRALPSAGTIWTASICRNTTTPGERRSTWAYLVHGFHDPARFNPIVFPTAADNPRLRRALTTRLANEIRATQKRLRKLLQSLPDPKSLSAVFIRQDSVLLAKHARKNPSPRQARILRGNFQSLCERARLLAGRQRAKNALMRLKHVTALPRNRVQARTLTITLPENANSIERFAAEELRKHLLLITGTKPQITNAANVTAKTFALHVGTRAPDDKKPLAREEARYTITRQGAWIYGEDKIQRKSGSDMAEILNMKFNRTGTLFAVYAFLENEFGVRWIEPGDRGIVYSKQPAPELTPREYSWIPRLQQRQLRSNSWSWRRVKAWQADAPKGCCINEGEAARKDREEKVWLRRMRMGGSIVLNYGHAFTRWWEEYGKTHPEWFAMSPQGKRGPWANGNKPDRVKMCTSNPELPKEVVRRWLKAREQNSVAYETINVCENDSRGYCRCKACMALDTRKPGEAFLDHLTDRYIHFANAILTKARRHVPDARAVMYAYSDYKFPPRREKVLPGLILGFVPTGTPAEIERMYQGWRAAGAREMFLRPNDMHMDMGLPSGFDQDMFTKFKLGIKYGIIGTDYDSLHSFWPISGLGDYALARGHIDPNKPFTYWEDEYCGAYGVARDRVKAYYQYWRVLRKQRILPHRKEITERGRYGNFRRGLFWLLEKFYRESDFDKTDTILQRGLAENPAPQARERLQRLILANRHARLMFRAIEGTNQEKESRGKGAEAAAEKLRRTRALIDFRRKYRDKLSIAWPRLFGIERTYGDLTGILWARFFKDVSPVRALPIYWQFRMDKHDTGIKLKFRPKIG